MARPTETTSDDTAFASASAAIATSVRERSAFERAQRHSTRVRLLKGALPALAVLMAVGFVVYSYVVTPAAVALTADGSAYADGKLVMANPKLEGFTKDSRPYQMKASRAVQDPKNEAIVQLEGIAAKLPISNDNWAMIDTSQGVYNREANTLNIPAEILITTADGMVAKLKSAFLDIAKGGMKTDDPIDIQAKGTKITSDSMSILENGKVLVFEKRVRMNIDPTQVKAEQNSSGGQNVVQ
ncbi:LPS export ABC transporter periplasmic protein LptC [Pseudaminobacter soli (ex Li et al. 2025)]|uniref:LPS export ABC transporter periplasmic protein LptC n=1 Tax=Pseudaminobacter soli (ex Li et al. 2025) TaxID=1295366 RepID=A0A2P7RZJ0_9HYPH|nr:LPS export ABC transporter periplasmic protein LptC [Mesorhizobium soli]PSJ55657.1 LPS export ABC transporter periplasmic protein LptC [Mesorhizobium soli]